MRILLYEFITGGGCFSLPDAPTPAGSFLVEGQAMRNSLASDLLAAGHDVVSLLDARLARQLAPDESSCVVNGSEDEESMLRKAAAECEAAIVIAPEMDGQLTVRCQWAEESGCTVLPPAKFAAAWSDKNQVAVTLGNHNVSIPSGIALTDGELKITESFFPGVLKPADGAGSLDVFQVADSRQVHQRIANTAARDWRLETLVRGQSCSVGVLCGPAGGILLPPWEQLHSQTSFVYLGGRGPLTPELAERALHLARQTSHCLQGAMGYVGIDMILGPRDTVIEVNPRLTTSYVGYSALCERNLADAMIRHAQGAKVELCWRPGSVQFDAAGNVTDS